ncbi:UNVERIFIED_CONTAM: hypothetical protein Sindi_2696300 [Sesamum indicum]
MADGTRLKELQEAQKKTEVVVMDEKARRQASEEELHRRMDQMAESMVEQLQIYNRNKSVLGEGLTASMERGSSSRAAMNTTYRPEGTNPLRQEGATTFRQETLSPRQTSSCNALNKLEFPYFDGDNARSSARRCTRYFQMIRIPEDQKVFMASVYMQGRAELWFEDLDYERVMTAFNKLQYETTVNAYLERFEELKDQMLIFNKNLEEEFFKMKFISGLKDEIKTLVSTCDPISLNQAVVLARKQEFAVSAILKKAQPINRNP